MIASLEVRGIASSIASRNDEGEALAALERLGIRDLFVFPQISLGSKADSVRRVAAELNIGTDALAFVDDSAFERASVSFELPEVLLVDAEDLSPLGTTTSTATVGRVDSYRQEERRRKAERSFDGSRVDFLRSCEIEVTIREATPEDYPRVIELAGRTNQMNSSGMQYAVEGLAARRVLVADMRDQFGDYGTVGTVVVHPELLLIESLMVSCRADGRGLAAAIVCAALRLQEGASALALYTPTPRNSRLPVLLAALGFHFTEGNWDRNGADPIPPYPEWLTVRT